MEKMGKFGAQKHNRRLLMIIIFIFYVGETEALVNNIEVFVDDMVSIRCYANAPIDIQWHFNSIENLVFAGGRLRPPYNQRFRTEDYNAGTYTLIIPKVRSEDAGWYYCSEELTGRRISSTHLTVLHSDPVCYSNMHPDGFIGPNTCNLQQENMIFNCVVSFNGTSPHLMWRSLNDNRTINSSICDDKPNRRNCSLILKSDPIYDGSIFICQTASIESRLICSTEAIKILYFSSTNDIAEKYVSDNVNCSANSNLNVKYNWTLTQNNKTSFLSSNQNLLIQKPGMYQCEVNYGIRNYSCLSLASVIYVSVESTNDGTTSGTTALAIIFPVAFMLAVLCIGTLIFLRKRTQRMRENQRIRNKIEEMYTDFVLEVDPYYVFQPLIQKRIINEEDADDVLNKETTEDNCRTLLDHLFSSSHREAFIALRKALRWRYPMIVARIDAIDISPVTKNEDKDKKLEEEKALAIIYGRSAKKEMIFKVRSATNLHLVHDSQVYPMNRHLPRGRVLIINNHYFIRRNLTSRHGAEFDGKNLKQLFEQLSFTVEIHDNLCKKKMKKLLEAERAHADHAKASMFILFILSHGSQGNVLGTDGKKMSIENDITSCFTPENAPSLKGKPKIFFIQACQGEREGQVYVSDSVESEALSETDEEFSKLMRDLKDQDMKGFVPGYFENQDVVMSYATVKGYCAWRQPDLGSWFVRCLVHVFSQRSHSEHFLDMLTEVNSLLSKLKTDKSCGQLAEKSDTLRKKLYLFPGADSREALEEDNKAEDITIAEFSTPMESSIVVVGFDNVKEIGQDVLKINLSGANEVSTMEQLPSPMQREFAAAVYGNSLFVTGLGENWDKIWKFDARSSTWEYCTSIIRGRKGHSVAFVDHVLYICGGLDYDEDKKIFLEDVETYDTIDDRCTTVGKLVHAIHSSGNCVPFKSSLYIFGGIDANYVPVDYVQVYDTCLNACTLLSKRMPFPCRLLRAVLVENKAILLGCDNCLIYNFYRETWQMRDQFKIDAIHFGMIVHDDKLFVIGGTGRRPILENKQRIFRDDVRSVPVANVLNNESIEWSHYAKLPKPTAVFSFGKMEFPVQ